MRRIAPGLIGLSFGTVILWRTAAELEREADGQQSFAVIVDAPAKIVALTERPSTADEPPIWQGHVRPTSELERVVLTLDGSAPIEQRRDADTGTLELPLHSLLSQPGWHFVELTIDRRGGRRERVVDPVLVGRFAPNPALRESGDPERAPICAASFTASPELVHLLVMDLLERELLPALRESEHMGPHTQLGEVGIALGEGLVSFDLELLGSNALAVTGIISVEIVDGQSLHAELVTLDEVDFRGELRNSARGLGAGGGAIVGGLIGGPLAPIGAAAGWYLADKYVSKKAREVVREQIDAGLAQLANVELLPSHFELIPGQPGSRVALGFCEQTGVRALGLTAGLWIEPAPAAGPEGDRTRFELGVPGPLFTGTTPTIDPLASDEDLRVELSIDLVNALLTEWTASGMLAELIGEQKAIAHANEELDAWTPLRLRSLTPTRPPTLTPVGGPEAGWAYGLGGLSVALEGVDEQPWGELSVAAAGTLSPSWDPEAGELSLVGSLDRLELTCAESQEDSDDVALSGCFSELLEAAEVRSRIDAHLRPGARDLPKLALRELLDDELGLQLDALELTRPRPGVLRLAATVAGPDSAKPPAEP
ncbi:MAG: hypothetical protein M3N56_16900 [Actinomycetota bacterium]|nr:hypothetical protein [Actinomycetota bacterium]